MAPTIGSEIRTSTVPVHHFKDAVCPSPVAYQYVAIVSQHVHLIADVTRCRRRTVMLLTHNVVMVL